MTYFTTILPFTHLKLRCSYWIHWQAFLPANEISSIDKPITYGIMECASTTPEGFYIVSGLQEVSQNTPFQARPLRRCWLWLKLWQCAALLNILWMENALYKFQLLFLYYLHQRFTNLEKGYLDDWTVLCPVYCAGTSGTDLCLQIPITMDVAISTYLNWRDYLAHNLAWEGNRTFVLPSLKRSCL